MSLLTTQAQRSATRLCQLRHGSKALQLRTVTSSAQDVADSMLEKYEGTTLLQKQSLDPHQSQKLSLMLNRRDLRPATNIVLEPPKTGTPLPAGYHLVYMTPASLEDDLGVDGSDKTYNPPGRFTRRMWAGGSMKWNKRNNLRIGDDVEERTRLLSAVPKTSRSGHEMVLVELEKEFSNSHGTALIDRRSWIFQPADVRASVADAAPARAPASALPYKSVVRDAIHDDGGIHRHFRWSPAALFRFSALTYNGHMIHYSDPWCQDFEGFPGPVVHGPLNLINMLDLWRDVHGNGGDLPSSIRYRALAPLYAGSSYTIMAGKPKNTAEGQDGCEILVTSGDGAINMKGEVAP